jgi:hypothetical protein
MVNGGNATVSYVFFIYKLTEKLALWKLAPKATDTDG